MSSTRRLNPLSQGLAYLVRLVPMNARLLMLALAAALTALIVTVFDDSLETLQENLGALGWTLNVDNTLEQRFSIIAIDEKSVAQEGAWPWPRDTMARLVASLTQAGVSLQLHDIVFPESSAGDDALASALQAAPGAVLAQLPVLGSEQVLRTGSLTHAVTGINCESGLPATSNYLGNNASFLNIPKGHIAPIVSADGAIRKMPGLICVDGQAYPALPISAFLQALNTQVWAATLSPTESLFGPAQTLQLDAYPGLRIPLDAQGNLRISYRNSPSAYRVISAADVLNGDIDAGMLENSWVLIGATAFGIGDIVPTPYSGATQGVELQARILGSLLDTNVPYTPSGAWLFLLALCAISAAVLFALAGARERFASYGLPIAGAVLPLLALGLHIELLNMSNIWLGWVSPALFSVCAASALMLLEQARVRNERSRVFGNLNAYLPSDVAKEIAFSLPSSSVNARRSEVTLLSADLRNFSAFSEARPPEESAALLHYFFVRAAEIVEQHGGRIHEFKGDGLLAVWDGHDARAAQQALSAAQSMEGSIARDMPQAPPEGLEPLALGIGIEQGPVLIGSIGPAQRRTHTLLGDTVTIALRIQEMTTELALPILVGECAARNLQGQKLESQGSYLLTGLNTPHVLFSPPLDALPVRRAKSESVTLTVLSGGKR